MGRGVYLVITLVSFCAGCASPRCVDASAGRARWDRLSATLRRAADDPNVPRPSEPTGAERESLIRVAETARQALVLIETQIPSTRHDGAAAAQTASRASGGTGVIIDPNGVVLTNAHVVQGATELCVVLADGQRHEVQAVAVDPRLDLALLRIAVSNRAVLTPCDGCPAPGVPVVAVGCAPTDRIRAGILTSADASLQVQLDPTGQCRYGGLLESTVPIEPGFSGGPLLDRTGRLIGLNVALAGRGLTQRSYAVPFTAATRAAIASLTERL